MLLSVVAACAVPAAGSAQARGGTSGARPAQQETALTPVHRSCGLTDENAAGRSDDPFIAISDPEADEKLECLASAGDHEMIGEYAYALITSDQELRPPDAEQRAYRWAMTALRNYLGGLGIDLDDQDFIEQYRRLGAQPGYINLNGPSDRLYYYSTVQRQLVRQQLVTPTESDRAKLEIIDKLDPRY